MKTDHCHKTYTKKLNTDDNGSLFYTGIKEKFLFFFILFFQLIVFLPLLTENRIPSGHDGLSYFSSQHNYLVETFTAKEIPLWDPLNLIGCIRTLWFILQTNFLQNVLLNLPHLPIPINSLKIFPLGMLLDEMILLIGIWLLTKRFYQFGLSTFFVSASLIGSSIWMIQPFFNFHFYYAVPLILHLGHCFLEKGQWRYFFLMNNLLCLQVFGNVPYFFPVISLIVFLYFLFYVVCNFSEAWPQIKNIRWGLPWWGSLMTIALFYYGALTLMKIGTDQIICSLPGRLTDGSTPLNDFLTYGRNLSWSKWIELLIGASPALDHTLFIGILTIPLALWGFIFNTRRKNFHFILVGIIICLFGVGSAMTIFFYHVWPFMKFYRHLGLIAPFTKIFIAILAGFGIDALIKQLTVKDSSKSLIQPFLLLSLIIFILGFKLFSLHRDQTFLQSLVEQIDYLPAFMHFDVDYLKSRLFNSSIVSLLFAFGLASLFFIKEQKLILKIFILFMALHVFNLYDYRNSETYLKTKVIRSFEQSISGPFSVRRTEKGLINQRNDFWLKPLDRFAKAYQGQSPINSKLQRKDITDQRLVLPLSHPAAKKFVGLTEDKIQFFQNAYVIDDESLLADLITKPDYQGDLLFVSSQTSFPQESSVKVWTSQKTLFANERIKIPYEIVRFNFNNLTLKVFNSQPNSLWLLYSDVWHPFWKANVNGINVPVYRANLAFKAISLQPGNNKIHFRFENKLMTVLLKILGVNSLFWIIFTLGMAGRILFGKQMQRYPTDTE